MDNKDSYFHAMKHDQGRLDEIELGEELGLDEDTTRSIISALLAEYKIEYVTNGRCHYRVIKK